MTQKTSDAIDVGIRIAREFGFPVVMLCVVVFCFREAAMALHQTVLIPAVQSHATFLKQTSETLQSLGRTQERQAETLEELAAGQRHIQNVLGGPAPAPGASPATVSPAKPIGGR
jgi:hypothetical protein